MATNSNNQRSSTLERRKVSLPPLSEDQKRMHELFVLKALDLSAKNCLKAGYSVTELKKVDNWFSLTDFVDAGYSVADLCNAGYTLEQLRDQRIEDDKWKELFDSKLFTIEDFKAAKFTVTSLKRFGAQAEQLLNAGYTLEEVVAQDVKIDIPLWRKLFYSDIFSLEQLRVTKCPATVLVGFGVASNALIEAGYQPREIYSVEECKKKFSSFEIIRKMGYSNEEIRNVFDTEELRDQNVELDVIRKLGYSNEEIHYAFTVSDLKAQSISFDEIKKLEYENEEIRKAFTVLELRDQRVRVDVIRELGYSEVDILSITAFDREAAGITKMCDAVAFICNEEKTRSEKAVEEIVTVINSLCNNKDRMEHRRQFCSSPGAIQALVKALHTQHMSTVIAKQGLELMWALSYKDGSDKISLGTFGACQVLVKLLDEHGMRDEGIAKVGVKALSSLSFSDSNSLKFGNCGGCEVLFKLIDLYMNTTRSTVNRSIAKYCSWSLLNLVTGNSSNAAKMRSMGMIEKAQTLIVENPKVSEEKTKKMAEDAVALMKEL